MLILPRSVRITSVAAGAEHCLLLSIDGAMLSFGSNKLGQLGVRHREFVNVPEFVKWPSERERPVDIVCGQFHSAALTDVGSVFTWGWGVHGQLGLANSIGLEDSLQPCKITSIRWALLQSLVRNDFFIGNCFKKLSFQKLFVAL